jgi:flagellar biosynthesis/type III secretory pathway chaperone
MRNSIRTVSLFPAVLVAALSCVLAVPSFASGDDKPAAPSTATAPTAPPTAPAPKVARPDREKKVYTNDDIDQMWPKPQAVASDSQTYPASAYTPPVARRPAAVSRPLSTASAPPSRENNPLWYAAQVESLYAELDSISSRAESLRDFRATGSDAGVTIGLQFDAPCEGITTDNAIEQLAIRRQEIEEQINELQDMALQNGVPPAVFQDPSEILQAARKQLSPGQQRAALIERQSELIAKLDGVQNQLADMSSEAAAQGIVLLPPTPEWGGNLTTNRIQSLEERAYLLQNALGENEDAARQAGLAPSALP